MSNPSPIDESVLALAQQHYRETLEGRSVAETWEKLTAATSRLPIVNMMWWENQLRAAAGRAAWQARSAQTAANSRRWPWTCLWRHWPWRRPAALETGEPPSRQPWLDLISHDGHQRERALRELTLPDAEPMPSAFFGALALRRFNDWVPEVRAAAGWALPRVIARADSEAVVSALWLMLMHWRDWDRITDDDRRRVMGLIHLESVADRFKKRLVTSPTGPVAALLTELGRLPGLDGWLVEIARDAVQPMARARACGFLLDGRVSWTVPPEWTWDDRRFGRDKGHVRHQQGERPLSVTVPVAEVLQCAVADRSARVRLSAARGLMQRLHEPGLDARAFANIFAADPEATIAEWGRFALARLDGTA